MKDRLHLVANIGGEEWPEAVAPPSQFRGRALLEHVAALWSVLFDDHARIVETAAGATGRPGPWPEALGPRPTGPAFSWLPSSGVVPWLVTPGTEAVTRGVGDRSREALARTALATAVRRVHDKAFAAEVAARHGLHPEPIAATLRVFSGDEVGDPSFVESLADRVRRWPAAIGGRIVLKPRWGGSGRAVRRGRPTQLGRLPPTWLRHGAVLEPLLERDADDSTQAYVDAAGQVHLIGTTRMLMDARGAPVGNRGRVEADGRLWGGQPYDVELRRAATIVVTAAAAAGYRGPCGIDAFTFRWDGGLRLRSVVELNARFTTGHIALGMVARARQAGHLAKHLAKGGAWCFLLRSSITAVAEMEAIAGLAVVPLRIGGSLASALLVARDDAPIDRALRLLAPLWAP